MNDFGKFLIQRFEGLIRANAKLKADLDRARKELNERRVVEYAALAALEHIRKLVEVEQGDVAEKVKAAVLNFTESLEKMRGEGRHEQEKN